MPSLQYGLSSFERARGDLPDLPVINMFAEEAPTEQGGVVLQSRPALIEDGRELGGPVQALIVKQTDSDDFWAVADGEFYDGESNEGVIDGTGPVSMANSGVNVFAAAGGSLWSYDGTLATVAFPDGANVIKVLMGGSRLVAIRENSHIFYWTAPLGDTIDPLDFASAETKPDWLRDALFIDDVLVLFGAETVEFWPNTGDAELPFAPLEGRVFEKGIKATGCATVFDSSFAFVGSDDVVYYNTGSASPISNAGLEEKIQASTSCALFSMQLDGHELLVLRLNSGTWVFSSRSKMWSELQSYGETNFVGQCFAGGFIGSAIDGRILKFGDGHLDLGGPLERRFRGGLALNGGRTSINNLRLRANPGQTPYLTGQYADPIVEMRVSRDAGQTWGAWKPASLGQQGRYAERIEWRAQGQLQAPGGLFEFRVTDPVPFSVSGVYMNEAW